MPSEGAMTAWTLATKWKGTLDSKETNILIQITSDTLEGVQDVGKVGMYGQGDLIAHGIRDNLRDAVQGIRRILGKARTERVKKFALEVSIEHPKDVIFLKMESLVS